MLLFWFCLVEPRGGRHDGAPRFGSPGGESLSPDSMAFRGPLQGLVWTIPSALCHLHRTVRLVPYGLSGRKENTRCMCFCRMILFARMFHVCFQSNDRDNTSVDSVDVWTLAHSLTTTCFLLMSASKNCALCLERPLLRTCCFGK